MAEANQGHVDNPKIDRTAIFVTKSHPFHRSRAYRTDHYVHRLHQSKKSLAPTLIFEIKHDAPFVAVGHNEKVTHPIVAERRYSTSDISFVGLDFDHLRAVIAKNLAC